MGTGAGAAATTGGKSLVLAQRLVEMAPEEITKVLLLFEQEATGRIFLRSCAK